MYDQYNRKIEYMRISITDRCNLNCIYCKGFDALTHNDILRYEEILDICKVAVQLGIGYFKITGGEPCARKGYLSFIESLKKMDGVHEVTITTNASLLKKEDIDTLKRIGIDGINVSLDTLDKECYKEITGKDCIDLVVHNILYMKSIGLHVKINSVLLDETRDEEFLNLIDFGNLHSIPIRFIERMPMKDDKVSHRTKKDILSLLDNVEIDKNKYGNGPASYYQTNRGTVGFIEPVHGKFCDQCNRIRLTSTGYLKACLFHKDGMNVRNRTNLEDMMKEIIYNKPQGHDFEKDMAGISMSKIGG